jgi:hypothetical protein
MDNDDRAVTTFMKELAAAPVHERSRLAPADLLWLKAELLRRWEAERRVRAPLDVMEPIQIAAALAAAAGVLLWAMPSVMKALAFIHM